MGLETAHPRGPRSSEQANDGRGLRARGRTTASTGSDAARLPAHLAAVRPCRRAGRLAAAIDRRRLLLPAPPSCRSFRPGPGNGALEALAAEGAFRRSTARRHRAQHRAARWPAVPIAAGSSSISGISSGSRAARTASSAARATPRASISSNASPPQPSCRACGFGVDVMTVTPIEHVDADVAVVGSGFAGSLVALALTRRGRRVAMIERGRHPRFAIGESSTPLANLLLEELADRYDLPRIRAFSKWGTWQRDAAGGRRRASSAASRSSSIVRARRSPTTASTRASSWSRPARTTRSPTRIGTGRTSIRRSRATPKPQGSSISTTPRLDRMRDEGDPRGARGHAARPIGPDLGGVRGRRQRAARVPPPGARRSTTRRSAGSRPLRRSSRTSRTSIGGTTCMPPDEAPPYPPDDAALHHVFPGGWIWVLRFNNGITSAGAALTDPLAAALGAADGRAGLGSAARDARRRSGISSGGLGRCTRSCTRPRLAFRTDVVTGSTVGAACRRRQA